MDLPGVGADHKDVAEMKDNPMVERVIACLPWLVIFAVAYLVARCLGWNPEELKR
jgi:hypothetical protein